MGGWAIAQCPFLGTTITIERHEKRGYISLSSKYKVLRTLYLEGRSKAPVCMV